MIGVYIIKSKIRPDRVYVGSATSVRDRWNTHRWTLRKGTHHSIKQQRHYDKYGEEDLMFEVLCICEKHELANMEQLFMDLYSPWFNSYPTARSPLGHVLSEETKNKIRESNLGRKRSDETKRRIGDSSRGRQVSLETRQKLRELALGERNNFYGRHHTEETKAKISESKKGRYTGSDNPFYGKSHTPEAREKMRQHHRDSRGSNHHNYGKKMPSIWRNRDWHAISVIDTETNIVYPSLARAAMALGLNYDVLRRIFQGKRQNNTTLRRVESWPSYK
jgi:hypothetical protein